MCFSLPPLQEADSVPGRDLGPAAGRPRRPVRPAERKSDTLTVKPLRRVNASCCLDFHSSTRRHHDFPRFPFYASIFSVYFPRMGLKRSHQVVMTVKGAFRNRQRNSTAWALAPNDVISTAWRCLYEMF